MKKIIVLSIVAVTMIWAQGMGQGKGRGGMQNRLTFATLDLNSDGQVTQEEFTKAQAARMTQRANEGRQMKNAGNAPTFESIDSNGDQVVTPEEFSTFQMNHRQGRGKGRGREQQSN